MTALVKGHIVKERAAPAGRRFPVAASVVCWEGGLVGVVAGVADHVVVMYGGDIVEKAPVKAFFARPTHPYARALLAAMPRVDRPTESLEPIPGQVPTLAAMPEGCRFQGRCPLREDACARRPDLTQIAPDHFIRCVVVAREAR